MKDPLVLFFFLVLSIASAFNCTFQWECSGVTTNYNYVGCVEGRCQCRESLGFEGTATVEDPCRCESPASVHWESGSPYCISFEDAAAQRTRQRKELIHVQKVDSLYSHMVYPTPLRILSGELSLDHLLSPNLLSRVDPVGVTPVTRWLIDYLFGLGATHSHVLEYEFEELMWREDVVFTRARVLFEDVPPLPPRLWNLTENARYFFDSQDRIFKADIGLLNLGKSVSVEVEQYPAIIEGLCNLFAGPNGYCGPSTDPTGYYANVDECISTLAALPIGSFDDLRQRSVSCVQFHGQMVPYAPSLHCPDVGRTGGHFCVDRSYSDYYLQDPFQP